jgi:hypothetical protein
VNILHTVNTPLGRKDWGWEGELCLVALWVEVNITVQVLLHVKN